MVILDVAYLFGTRGTRGDDYKKARITIKLEIHILLYSVQL